jgi:hypothetical protein
LRRAANIDQIDLQPLLIEISSLFGSPHPGHGAAHGGVGGAHSDFLGETGNGGQRKKRRDEKEHNAGGLNQLGTPRKATVQEEIGGIIK